MNLNDARDFLFRSELDRFFEAVVKQAFMDTDAFLKGVFGDMVEGAVDFEVGTHFVVTEHGAVKAAQDLLTKLD